ncbi:MAG: HAD family hydrolase, partial [Promethearchaeota archaeon]
MIKSGNDSFKNFKLGVIFDFDGTLFDDIHLTHDIVFKLAEYYRPDLPKEEVEKIYNEIAEYLSGISKKIVLLKALLHAGKRFKLNWFKRIKLISVTKDIYEEEIKKCKLFPDVRYVMDALKEKEYIALGLFTSTPIKIVKARLGEKDETHKNLLNYFDTIMTPEYYSKMKPHPSGILNIVR